MKIIKLILYKYKRFFLNNIEYFEYNPNEKIQIILGSNGSGKSSLLSELSPLPTDLKKKFYKDGYKEIHIEHNNKMYILSSGKIPGKHSFILDDEELNQSGTKQIQLELVKEHFNLTPKLFDIFLGKITFTNMSIAERRKLFMSISKTDFTYALKVFDKAKQRNRDIVGGIKLLNNKLLEIENSLISKEDKEILITKLKYLKSFLDDLLISKTNNIYLNDIDYVEVLTNLELTGSKLLSRLTIDKNINLDNIDKVIFKTDFNIAELKKKIDEINSILEKIMLTENITHNNSKHSISIELNKLNKKLKEIESKNEFDLNLDDIESIYNTFNNVYPDIISILTDLVETNYLEDNINKIIKETEDLNSKSNLISNLLEKKKSKLEELKHIDTCEIITCPKCNHSFNKELDIKQIKILEKEIKDLKDKKETLDKKLNKNQKEIEIYKEREELIKSLKQIILNTPILKNIWTELFTKYNYKKDQDLIKQELFKILNLIKELHIYKSIKEKILKLENDLKLIKIREDLQNDNKLKNKEDLEVELGKLRKELKELINFKNDLEFNKEIMIKLSKIRNEIIKILSNKKKMLKKEIEKLRNDLLNEAIILVKDEIAKIETKINESNHYEKNKEMIMKDLEDLKQREKVTKKIVKALSPNEGLIAESIFSFLNNFVKNMNYIIENVWSYKMEVLPCKLEDSTELDYKFPVRVEDREIIDDVSMTSSAMNEIINLAFKITIMKYLDMKDYPLFLDEFGSKMDETHRTSAYEIIDTILNSNFNQIFLVSHFESMYGRFNNSDIIILHKDNLSNSIKNNQEVVIIK